MNGVQDQDTRYFIDICLSSLKVIQCGYAQKENLAKGHQVDPAIHRLFVTQGQYNKMVSRCANELASIIDR